LLEKGHKNRNIAKKVFEDAIEEEKAAILFSFLILYLSVDMQINIFSRARDTAEARPPAQRSAACRRTADQDKPLKILTL
jgi:hypothetical protein